MAQEIERKWFVKSFPKDIKPINAYVIKQSYLITGEKELRLRKIIPVISSNSNSSIPSYRITLKGPGTFSRFEVETELQENQYNELIQFIGNKTPIFKEYCQYQVEDFIVEVSYVDNSWYYAEVEFDEEDNFIDYQFPWPELVIKEVTTDPKFKMKNYWEKTREQNQK